MTTRPQGFYVTMQRRRPRLVNLRVASADCLCSFWSRDSFHRHQFRREKHNRRARVFSHCKYFLSCQLPSLPALARSLARSLPSSLPAVPFGGFITDAVLGCHTGGVPKLHTLHLHLYVFASWKKEKQSTANKQPGPLDFKPVSNEQARTRVSVSIYCPPARCRLHSSPTCC